jgi:hypothetical protein
VMTDFEDDVRAMLHRRAGDGVPSADAWEQIQARLEADERPTAVVRRRPFQVVAGGAAAAALAALVVGQLVGAPSSQVATEPPVTEAPASAPDFPVVFAEPGATPAEAAAAYLEARAGVAPSEGTVVMQDETAAEIVFHDGPVFSDVLLRQGPAGWYVDSATSDLMQLYPSYTGTEIGGDITVEADGTLHVSYRSGDGDPVVEEEPAAVERLAMQVIEQAMPGEPYVIVQAVLDLGDGGFVVAESWVTHPETGAAAPDGGEGVDTYQGVWPAYTGDELAGYEDSVRDGSQPWLSDPAEVALAFLEGQVLPDEVTAQTGTFMQGDAASGEVPFTLSDGARGVVLVRKASAEARTWFVTFATTDGGPFDVRTEGGDVVIELRDGIRAAGAEARPLPGGDLVSAGSDDDGVIRLEGAGSTGIVKVVGSDADGTTVFTVSRYSDAG